MGVVLLLVDVDGENLFIKCELEILFLVVKGKSN